MSLLRHHVWFVLAAVGCASHGAMPRATSDGGANTAGTKPGGSGGAAAGKPAAGSAATSGGAGGMSGARAGVGANADGGLTEAGTAGDTRSPKRGVAYDFCKGFAAQGQPDREALRMGAAATSGIAWYYNWGARPGTCLAGDDKPSVEYVPMVWGLTNGGSACASGGVCFNDGLTIASLTEDMPASARYLLGFNEPNFAHQANLTPTVAAQAWKYLEQIAERRKLLLVAPATNYCDTSPDKDHGGSCTKEPVERTFHFDQYDETMPAGHRYNAFEWAELFYDECSAQGAAGHDCQIDYQAGHVYSYWALDWYVETFKRKAGLSEVTEAHCKNGSEDADEFGVDCGGNACTACSAWARAQFGKALWLTEFAPSTDDGPSPRPSAQELAAHASEYIQSELPKLERDSFVFRYAWFMPRTDIPSLDHVDLLTTSMPPQLTPVGETYLNQPH